MEFISSHLPYILFCARIKPKLLVMCIAQRERVRPHGSALIAVQLFLLIRGLTELPSLRGGLFILSGIAVFSLYLFRHAKVSYPVIDMGLFRKNRCFSLSNAAIMIYTTSNLAAVFLFSLYLQDVKGLDARSAGLILLVSTLITATLNLCGRSQMDESLFPGFDRVKYLPSMTMIYLPLLHSACIMEMILISREGILYPH